MNEREMWELNSADISENVEHAAEAKTLVALRRESNVASASMRSAVAQLEGFLRIGGEGCVRRWAACILRVRACVRARMCVFRAPTSLPLMPSASGCSVCVHVSCRTHKLMCALALFSLHVSCFDCSFTHPLNRNGSNIDVV